MMKSKDSSNKQSSLGKANQPATQKTAQSPTVAEAIQRVMQASPQQLLSTEQGQQDIQVLQQYLGNQGVGRLIQAMQTSPDGMPADFAHIEQAAALLNTVQQPRLNESNQHDSQAPISPAASLDTITPESDTPIHQIAKSGFQGAGENLPYSALIQTAFGKYSLSQVRAYTNQSAQAANKSIGAAGYAMDNKIAFRDSDPDLWVVAHEAAHIIQQQRGVDVKNGVGEIGDSHEQHANSVADAVVQGQSAESLLSSYSSASISSGDMNSDQALQLSAIDETKTERDEECKTPAGAIIEYFENYFEDLGDFELSINKLQLLGENDPTEIDRPKKVIATITKDTIREKDREDDKTMMKQITNMGEDETKILTGIRAKEFFNAGHLIASTLMDGDPNNKQASYEYYNLAPQQKRLNQTIYFNAIENSVSGVAKLGAKVEMEVTLEYTKDNYEVSVAQLIKNKVLVGKMDNDQQGATIEIYDGDDNEVDLVFTKDVDDIVTIPHRIPKIWEVKTTVIEQPSAKLDLSKYKDPDNELRLFRYYSAKAGAGVIREKSAVTDADYIVEEKNVQRFFKNTEESNANKPITIILDDKQEDWEEGYKTTTGKKPKTYGLCKGIVAIIGGHFKTIEACQDHIEDSTVIFPNLALSTKDDGGAGKEFAKNYHSKVNPPQITLGEPFAYHISGSEDLNTTTVAKKTDKAVTLPQQIFRHFKSTQWVPSINTISLDLTAYVKKYFKSINTNDDIITALGGMGKVIKNQLIKHFITNYEVLKKFSKFYNSESDYESGSELSDNFLNAIEIFKTANTSEEIVECLMGINNILNNIIEDFDQDHQEEENSDDIKIEALKDYKDLVGLITRLEIFSDLENLTIKLPNYHDKTDKEIIHQMGQSSDNSQFTAVRKLIHKYFGILSKHGLSGEYPDWDFDASETEAMTSDEPSLDEDGDVEIGSQETLSPIGDIDSQHSNFEYFYGPISFSPSLDFDKDLPTPSYLNDSDSYGSFFDFDKSFSQSPFLTDNHNSQSSDKKRKRKVEEVEEGEEGRPKKKLKETEEPANEIGPSIEMIEQLKNAGMWFYSEGWSQEMVEEPADEIDLEMLDGPAYEVDMKLFNEEQQEILKEIEEVVNEKAAWFHIDRTRTKEVLHLYKAYLIEKGLEPNYIHINQILKELGII
jgi:hypothetical protein